VTQKEKLLFTLVKLCSLSNWIDATCDALYNCHCWSNRRIYHWICHL